MSARPYARTARRGIARLTGVLLAIVLVAACGQSDDAEDAPTSSGKADAGAFPTTIEHTFGETTIESQPKRIVTLGWNAQDVVYALGEEPVGMPSDSYGATDQQIKPWQTEYFDPDVTTLFDTTDGPPFEQIAALKPDVILAPYEGFDEKTYDTLSGIAPTVAYPDKAWQSTWQQQTEMIGQALGRSEDAQKLIDKTDKLLADTAEEHPEFAGKTVSVLSLGAEDYAYLPTDARLVLLTALGFENSAGVKELARNADEAEFAPEVSKEELDSVDADVIVGFASKAEEALQDPVYSDLGAFENDAAYILDDKRVIGGFSSVSVLSIPWTLDRVVPDLSKAAKAASR